MATTDCNTSHLFQNRWDGDRWRPSTVNLPASTVTLSDKLSVCLVAGHNDVMTWKSFSHVCSYVRGNLRWPVYSPHGRSVMHELWYFLYCKPEKVVEHTADHIFLLSLGLSGSSMKHRFKYVVLPNCAYSLRTQYNTFCDLKHQIKLDNHIPCAKPKMNIYIISLKPLSDWREWFSPWVWNAITEGRAVSVTFRWVDYSNFVVLNSF